MKSNFTKVVIITQISQTSVLLTPLTPIAMQTVCYTYRDAGKGNLTAQNTRKPFGGRGSAPDPAGGAYSASPDPLSGREGAGCPLLKNPTPVFGHSGPRLSCLPTPKLFTTPLLRMASLDTTILLIVDYYAAVGLEQDPHAPSPLAYAPVQNQTRTHTCGEELRDLDSLPEFVVILPTQPDVHVGSARGRRG